MARAAGHENTGVIELAREYQEYVIAHRVRALIGARLAPRALLTLSEYAARRLERQALARDLVTRRPFDAERLRRVDALTDELCFGMWRNPLEVAEFLRAAWRAGGHRVLESPEDFASLVLTGEERARLPDAGLEVARFHHACLRLAAAALHPEELERASSRADALARRVPLFLREFTAPPV